MTDTIDLPGLTLTKAVWEQVEKRRALSESMLGRRVDFRDFAGEILTEKVRNYTIA